MQEESPILRVRHRLFGQKPILKLMKNGDIDLVLCGHVHYPSCKVDDMGHGESIAGSVTRNGSLSEIDVDVENNRFSFKYVSL